MQIVENSIYKPLWLLLINIISPVLSLVSFFLVLFMCFDLVSAMHGKSYRLRQKYCIDSNKNKEATTTMVEGSGEGKEGVLKNKLEDIMLKAEPESSKMGAQNLKIFTFDELRRATRNFRPSAMLGASHGESVYKGWVDKASYTPSVLGVGITVAIKISNTDNVQSLNEWQEEVNRGKFSHPNLVKLLGYCSEDRILLLVHEYTPKRNLIDISHRYPLSWCRTMKIAIGVAKGLDFVHNHKNNPSTPLFRTFNASNILLNEDDEVQLYFGCASLCRKGGALSMITSNADALTNRYNPPEYMATGHWYIKSDVYAFGVIMLDMIAGLGFLKNTRGYSRQRLLATRILSDNKAAELILSCLEIAPDNRPSMQEIMASLQEINDMQVLPK